MNRCQEPAIDARTRGVVPNEEKSPCSTPAEGDQMSPKNALRAAMLKRRFADTIFKAHQKLVYTLNLHSTTLYCILGCIYQYA